MTSQERERRSATLLSAGLMAIAAAALFAAMNMAVRALGQLESPALPAFEVAFFRFLFGLLTASPLIVATGWGVVRTQAPGAHALRVLAGGGGVGAMFAALAQLPLGFVTAISFSNPFFAVIFAALFLGERVGPWRWSAVGFGFCGVLVMTGVASGLPISALEPAVGLAVMAAVFFGVEVVMIRRLALTENFATVLLYNNLGAMLLLAAPAALVWKTPSPEQWPFLALSGLFGVVGQMLFLTAMRIAEASFVSPFLYLSLVFAMAYGFAFFSEVPTQTTVAGAAMITAAGLFILYREQLARRGRPGSD